MLASLHIENVAVIRSLDIDLCRGFSSMTGETGAGKSIMIDSVGFLLGARADREMLRHGEKTALVSAVFEALSTQELAALSAAGISPDEEGRLLLQRTLSSDGHSTVRINGRAVTLAVLREIAPALIHIHGQSDNRLLTDPENHIRILDAYAEIGESRVTYEAAYAKLTDVRRRLRELTIDEGERLRMIEMLRFQIADIDAVSPVAGEEETLQEKRLYLKNAEKINKQTSFAYRALKGSEKGSVTYILSRTTQALDQLDGVLPKVAELSEKLDGLMWQIDDIAEQIADATDVCDGDPTEELNRIEDRLHGISRLIRKYGPTLEDVVTFREKAAARLDELEGVDSRRAELEKEERAAIKEARAAADVLHTAREKAAALLQKEITEALVFLDMPAVRFAVKVAAMRDGELPLFDRNGYDHVAFMIATNPGEALAPMVKIASGGELSRIMLALKSVITDKDGISTVIYDEIDTGVSGKTARKIGVKLKESSARTQILCVTHSAQIASLADTHFLIEKRERDGRAETSVKVLSGEARVEELARILGGLSVTESQRRAAMDMLAGV